MSVLGAVLQSAEALRVVADILTPDAFFSEHNATIYAAILDVVQQRGEEADLTTVTNELRRCGTLETVGSHGYLCSLIETVPTAANVAHHAHIVREKAAARRVLDLALRLAHAASVDYEWHAPLASLVDVAMHGVMVQAPAPAHATTLREVLATLKDALVSLAPRFVRTPFPGVNARLCGGLLPGELCYIGARPGVGKTALALEVARGAAGDGVPVLIISREMVMAALGRRLVSQAAQVSASLLRRHALLAEDWRSVQAAMLQLGELPIWLTDSAISITQIAALVETQDPAPGLVIVDYLQLVRAKAADRRLEVEAVSQGLKALAMRHHIPVVCLCSLARIAGGPDMKPTLGSLRESGALEHDADFVILLHRLQDARETEVMVVKARDGSTGTVHLDFTAECVHFRELTDRVGDGA